MMREENVKTPLTKQLERVVPFFDANSRFRHESGTKVVLSNPQMVLKSGGLQAKVVLSKSGTTS